MRRTPWILAAVAVSIAGGYLVVLTRGGRADGAPSNAEPVTAENAAKNAAKNERADTMSLRLTSPSFQNEGEIPTRHTCEGSDVAPALGWSGAPPNTQSFALVVDDPDAPDPRAPKTTWVHWVLYDIPAHASSLPEAAHAATLPKGTREGSNDWKQTGYRGPCPPIGRHRYFFKLYALDTQLGDRGHLSKAALEQAMEGHVVARGQLLGTYEKKHR